MRHTEFVECTSNRETNGAVAKVMCLKLTPVDREIAILPRKRPKDVFRVHLSVSCEPFSTPYAYVP